MEYIIESDVKEFINRLPPLNQPYLVHLMMLAARSRRCREIMGFKIKDLLMKREIIRAIPDWKDRYLHAVHNLAILQHAGQFQVNDTLVPPEAFGILATLSPRNVMTATEELVKETIKYTFMSRKDPNNYMELAKVNSHFFSYLHKHKDRSTNFVTLDIDTEDAATFNDIHDLVTPVRIHMITETSRGFHITLNLTNPSDAQAFYGKKPQDGIIYALKTKYCRDPNSTSPTNILHIQRDSQEPIAGTLYYRKVGELHYVRILQ